MRSSRTDRPTMQYLVAIGRTLDKLLTGIGTGIQFSIFLGISFAVIVYVVFVSFARRKSARGLRFLGRNVGRLIRYAGFGESRHAAMTRQCRAQQEERHCGAGRFAEPHI